MSPGIRGLTTLKVQFSVNSKHKFVSVISFTQGALCSQSYLKSSEGDETHLERGKQKTEVANSGKIKGNCKTQIKTCY